MQKEIPEDASLVVVAAPEKRFSLRRWKPSRSISTRRKPSHLSRTFRGWRAQGVPESYGIQTSGDIVVDKMSRVMGGDYLIPMVANYGVHEITKDFRLTSFFPLARSIEAGSEKKKGVTVTVLAFTSPESWAETDRIALDQGRVALDNRDRSGPLSLAVVAELEPPRKPAIERKVKKTIFLLIRLPEKARWSFSEMCILLRISTSVFQGITISSSIPSTTWWAGGI
jgi:hypothetical protein